MRQPIARFRTAVLGWAAVRWIWARRIAVFDLAVALVTTGTELNLVVDGSLGGSMVTVLLTVLAGGLLLFRRRAPLLVLVGTAVPAAVLAYSHDYPGGAPVLVALYTVAELHERRLSLATLVPTMIFLQAASISSPPVSIIAWALGAYAQTRHRYLAALEERAAHLEREREQLNQIAVQTERVSIARELHDVVAHSVTVMLLGVRGARDVLRTSPEVAEDTLSRVETSAEQSIAELRRILVLLRSPDQAVEVHPAPSLEQLTELVDDFRRNAGLPVRLMVEGTARSLPGGVELSVYRIVEEALTNVLKHTSPAKVEVRLGFEASRLEILITDDGTPPLGLRPAPAPAPGLRPGPGPGPGPGELGHGILGMRERATALGGVLDAGPRPDGGFRVRARLPISPASPTTEASA